MARFSVKDNSGTAFLKFENVSDIVLTTVCPGNGYTTIEI
jgi:hypothetical protein